MQQSQGEARSAVGEDTSHSWWELVWREGAYSKQACDLHVTCM